MPAESSTAYTIRFPDSMLRRLDAHVLRISREAPGRTVTRSDAIRELLADALERAERKARER